MSVQGIIKLKDVHKVFNGLWVHRGINLSIKEGEIVSLIGSSGSGKTVLLKEVIGLLRPDKGEIFVMGRNVVALNEKSLLEIRKNVGLVFQGSALFDSLTVFDNIAYPLREHLRLGKKEIRERVAETLHLVGLDGVEGKMPAELSGGMKKRVAVARAIATNPKIMLYDEPNTGVDPINARKINELILGLREKLGVTSMVVTHDMQSVKMVTDRIAMLYDGKIVAEGTWKEFEESEDPFIREFMTGGMVFT
ncbi:MAG: ABC transporter ATP-binding protein [Candidatus Brocadiales bacterium]|nr:ABC transporter ATP-binding protein [Candidatus Brocadiales bacterium]